MALLYLAVPARAQDASQVQPKQLPPSQGTVAGTPAAPPPAATAANDDKLILPALKGLVLVPRAADIVKNGVTRSGVDASALKELADPVLAAQLNGFIGHPLTFGDLHAITRAIIAFARDHHRPLVDVAVPAQDVTTGTVQIIVTQFTVGHVNVAGNAYFSSDIIRDGIRIKPGDKPDLDVLRHDLDWLNRNPFRKVDAVLARGDAVGTTDINVQVADRFPLRLYAGFDNSGTVSTGRDHWSLGGNYGNLFGLDHQISYQFTFGDDIFGRGPLLGPCPDLYRAFALAGAAAIYQRLFPGTSRCRPRFWPAGSQ